MLRAVKVRIYPNTQQTELLFQHFGATRYVYNQLLDAKQKAFECKEKVSAYDLKKRLVPMRNVSKDGWLKKIDSTALQLSVLTIDTAYKNFFNGAGYPKFKSRHNSRQSYQTTNAQVDKEKSKVYLPKIGWVKAKLHREITTVKTVTVSMEANQFYASILTEFQDEKPNNSPLSVGLDVGVVNFAALSDNTIIEPTSFDKEQKRLIVLQKQLSNKQHSRKRGDTTPQSNNYKKQKLKVQKQHLKIANKRKDFLHKVSKQLSDKYNVVIVEDLKIKNMSKSAKGDENNHGKNVRQKSGLNKSILQQSWGMFFTMLEYKLISKGGRFEKIDPRYTSQECPICNSIAKENRESQSVFHCKSCHYEAMADYVASVNIKNRWINGDCLSSNRLKSVEQEALAL